MSGSEKQHGRGDSHTGRAAEARSRKCLFTHIITTRLHSSTGLGSKHCGVAGALSSRSLSSHSITCIISYVTLNFRYAPRSPEHAESRIHALVPSAALWGPCWLYQHLPGNRHSRRRNGKWMGEQIPSIGIRDRKLFFKSKQRKQLLASQWWITVESDATNLSPKCTYS